MSTLGTVEIPSGRPSPVPSTPAPTKRFDIRRVYTALVGIPIVFAAVCLLPPWGVTLLALTGGSIALLELTRMVFGTRQNEVLTGIVLLLTALLITSSYWPVPLGPMLLSGLLAALLTLLWSTQPVEFRFRDMGLALFGALYIGLTLSSLVTTRALPGGEWLIVFLALVTWAGDTGAYYAGTLWGRHPLAPSISPKKSVEGLVGGLVLSMIAAVAVQSTLVPQLTTLDALLLGTAMTVTGLLGDLCESAIKRSVGVKDSGGILPGHGGMLDRLDSLLFTAPTFYYYVTLVRGIAPLP